MPDFTGAEYVGDIELHKILFKIIDGHHVYGITVNDKPVGFVTVQNENVLGKDYLELKNIYVQQEYQGQNLAKKLLFFLKNVEKKSFVFGNVQSELGQKLIKSIAQTGRFPMFWLNTTTGGKDIYDYQKDHPALQPYRSKDRPTWVVVCEALEGKSFTSRFLKETDCNYWHKYILWFD